MELIGVSGTYQYVGAVPTVHHIFASVAVAVYRQRSDAIAFGEEVNAGATVIGVVAVFTVREVVPTASPQLVSVVLAIKGVPSAEGLDEVRVVCAGEGFARIRAFYDRCQGNPAYHKRRKRHHSGQQHYGASHKETAS